MKELKLHGEVLVIGKDALDYLKQLDSARVFITTGGGSMFKNGAIDRIKSILEANDCTVELHSGIQPNPSTEDVLTGLEKMKIFKPDVLIAVGGGSAIDASKVMALFYDYPELDFTVAAQGRLPKIRKHIKFIAVPSTSGTGTEVTRAAVITFKEKNYKVALGTDAFIPDVTILDPSITLSMPLQIVAYTGMDALTHAVECYINKRCDDFSACLAKGAVEGLFEYLPQSYEKGDPESREKVHNFQCMAGAAFSNTGLGMAHGIAHAIGGMYNSEHGLINAVVLPYVLEFNSADSQVGQKLAHLARALSIPDFIQGVRELNNRLNIPSSFRDMGIDPAHFEDNFEILVDNALAGPTRMNPVKITKEEMQDLLKKIYEGK